MEKTRILDAIIIRLMGRRSRFRVGDSVQLIHGGPLMIVRRIYRRRNMVQPLLECQWSEGKVSRKCLYQDKDLKLFDWYHPHR